MVFYVIPTFVLRSVLVEAKKLATKEVARRQESYYDAILLGRLHGAALREAHEYLRYFSDISTAIKKIPDWPHLVKVSSVFGISISPAVISYVVSAAKMLMKLYPNLHPSLP
jgi:hypothetical protein